MTKMVEEYMRTSIKLLLAFAGMPVLIPVLFGQQLTCTASVANQPVLRQEGASEAVGDILISCTTTSLPLVGAQAGGQTMSLYVNGVDITSRVLYSGSTAPQSIPTEAAVIVNDNVSSSPVNGASPPTQGFLQNGALIFSGFTLPSSGSNNFTIRITNLRVNAGEAAAGSLVTATVLATFGVTNQQNLVLGSVASSLGVNISKPILNSQQCTQQTALVSNLSITELTNSAFKVQTASGNTTPASGINQESIPNRRPC
jgi:hypothetical protein